MSQKYQPVRGTTDLLPEQYQIFQHIEFVAQTTSSHYGYAPVATPIFEFSEVFHRSLGETSDAVAKETYDFLDRGGDRLTLRPEGTAGVVRAMISNGLAQNLPLKFFYCGPMFRYERPQKGRSRQFHQIGVEALGYESPLADVETISLGYEILSALGLKDKITVEINTLGDKTSRSQHREALVGYLNKYKNDLSEDSQRRLEKNPMRIFDSKNEEDIKIMSTAPLLNQYWTKESQDFFEKVMLGLTTLRIPFVRNDRLVRGLDYYVHTVFEMTSTFLGAQSAVLSGGRYDGLSELLGGPPTKAVGWALGQERVALLVEAPKNIEKKIAVMAADDSCEMDVLKIAHILRQQKKSVEYIVGSNLGKNMKRANKIGAHAVYILGENEKKKGVIVFKDMQSGHQEEIRLAQFSLNP